VAGRDPHEFLERLRAVKRCLHALAARTYAELGLGSTQAKCLRHIGANSRISQAELARATDTAPTLIGRIVDALIERGWVRRKRSEEDRRQYLLELTASGQRVRQRVEDARSGMIEQVATLLDERDLDDFDRIASRILATFE
jgi:DNA-binding MarR family transcriptional regulator